MSATQTHENEPFDPLADPEERRVLHAAFDSFRQYRQAAHYNITHLRRLSFYSLPSSQIDILAKPPFSLPSALHAVDKAIDANADIADAILKVGLPAFGIDQYDTSWHGRATVSDMDKARSTIKQCYRDWSAEGQAERHASHTPILSALSTRLPTVPPSRRHIYRVLVPGAGLGRLVLELCSAGYSVEGNEISYHQLLASNYILNYAARAGQHELYPWALNFSNHLTRSSQLHSVAIPDIHPGNELDESSARISPQVHYSERMSMTAGDFCQVYRQAEYLESFDAVTTCFFIDTAPNVTSYIETVRHCLKPGGIWINLGPLLWHFESAPTPAERDKARKNNISTQNSAQDDRIRPHSADPMNEGIGEPGSFELSNDEVIALVEMSGFEILEQRQAPAGATGYIQDPNSMLQNVYRPAFWVAKKLS